MIAAGSGHRRWANSLRTFVTLKQTSTAVIWRDPETMNGLSRSTFIEMMSLHSSSEMGTSVDLVPLAEYLIRIPPVVER